MIIKIIYIIKNDKYKIAALVKLKNENGCNCVIGAYCSSFKEDNINSDASKTTNGDT